MKTNDDFPPPTMIESITKIVLVVTIIVLMSMLSVWLINEILISNVITIEENGKSTHLVEYSMVDIKTFEDLKKYGAPIP